MGSRYDLVIITGGSSGIGYSIIEGCLKVEPDALIINLSRRLPPSFSNVPNARHLECDLSDRLSRAKVLEELLELIRSPAKRGRILLVNNAGFGLYGETVTQAAPEHLALIEVNVCALVDLTTRLLPTLLERGGSIMNIASVAAFQPTPGLSTYGASKAFVLNWTLALNNELRGSGVRALAVCPGPTRTEFFERAGFAGKAVPAGYSHGADYVASKALEALDGRRSFIVTGLANKAATLLSGLLPLALRTRTAGRLIRRTRSQD